MFSQKNSPKTDYKFNFTQSRNKIDLPNKIFEAFLYTRTQFFPLALEKNQMIIFYYHTISDRESRFCGTGLMPQFKADECKTFSFRCQFFVFILFYSAFLWHFSSFYLTFFISLHGTNIFPFCSALPNPFSPRKIPTFPPCQLCGAFSVYVWLTSMCHKLLIFVITWHYPAAMT